MMFRTLLVVVLAAACDTGGGTSGPDAGVDAPVVAVEVLASCPATVAATVMDSATMFIPKATTVAAKGVVKFAITAEHSVLPNGLVTTDPALTVKRGETKCFRFNTPGTYGFLCGVHSFTGTITVQ